jgi:hypothetical protein
MKYIVQVDPNNGISLETKEEVITYLKHFGYENPVHMQGNEYEVSSLGDDLPAITILQKIPLYEDVKKEVNYEKELLEMVTEIRQDIAAIKEGSEFFKTFIEKYEIGTFLKEQYTVIDVTNLPEQMRQESEYAYVLYDNYNAQYVTDENGTIQSLETITEAQMAVDRLNEQERKEIIEIGALGVVDEGAIVSEADLIEKEEVKNGKCL